jgi:DNA invertase Pin-like site-specific DNA recombinase
MHKRHGGRPRVAVESSQVRQLREEGLSWRRIARKLGIGTATAMRIYDGLRRVPEASQNSPQEVTR